ncbi:AraC family transcriptional regulator [Pseudoduganella sp. RAF53_2]|uniref:AraC family transcriptional regulator n=1 Tax=unclassified Pseudoduganella TaxID=2637179 RepID=UPI003F97565A
MKRHSELLEALRAAVAPRFGGLPHERYDIVTAIPWLTLIRIPAPTPAGRGMLQPSMCLLLQGAKQMLIGADVVKYGPGDYVLTAVDMPVAGQVTAATPAHPYFGLRVDFDPQEIAAFILDMQIEAPPPQQLPATYVESADEALLDVFARLLELLDRPGDIPVLSRLLKQELFYHLLMAPGGAALNTAVRGGGREKAIGEAIMWIRQNFDKPLSIEALAKAVRMSTSVLHRRFKAMTVMSPLQYQKQVRLLEARKLLMAGGVEAATVAFKVGYESPSQFSREYRRLFGASPLQDAEQLRHAVIEP